MLHLKKLIYVCFIDVLMIHLTPSAFFIAKVTTEYLNVLTFEAVTRKHFSFICVTFKQILSKTNRATNLQSCGGHDARALGSVV